MNPLLRAVSVAGRRLAAIYRLDLALRPEHFVVEPEAARRLLPPQSPRSGLVVLEEEEGVSLGLYVDPADRGDPDTIVEETSHFVCIAWHAAQGRRVSRLILELQAEVDRYAVARLVGRDALRHFRHFRWAAWMDADTRALYQRAHRSGHRYCRSLSRRFPGRADTPGLLAELRRFYRATPEQKLHAA